MEKEQIINKVKAIIVDSLCCDEKDVTMDAKLGIDLGADSLDYVEMGFNAEREFGIAIPDEQTYFNPYVTVQECCDGLEKIINNK